MKTTIVKGRIGHASATPAPQVGDAGPDFRGLLRAELARRCAGNPRYSLRAFAKWLGIDHATLSQLLRGRRALTAANIRRLGARLKLDEASIQSHVVAQKQQQHRHRDAAAPEPPPLREVRQLTADAAEIIDDWRHFAVLELTRLDSFQPDSRWIARVLGVSVDEINIALQRLIRLGLLEMESRTRWIDRTGDAAVTIEGLANFALQRLAQQARDLALRAMSSPNSGLCDYSATTVAVAAVRLPEVIDRIARFRRELIALLERDQRRDDVYQLEINFFPLTQLSKEHAHGQPGRAMADAVEQTR